MADEISDNATCGVSKDKILPNYTLQDTAVKTGKIKDRKNWSCKACEPVFTSSDASEEEVTIIMNDESEKKDGFANLKKENIMLKDQIAILNKLILEMENKVIPSYSSALKTPKNVLIIKPTNSKQTTEETCKQLKDNIDPTSLSIEVNNIVPRRNGSVLINCNNSGNLNVLKSNIKEKFGNKLITELPPKINPKIIIYNVNADDLLDKKKFCENICVQNKLQKTAASILRVVRVIGKQSEVNVIVEVDSTP
ncbi:hypothetical protein QE152_g5621 [Popillia japonica]|uniref:Uncharacterized protein n=1 Tax=Popillia japonica TaxID=7064 RepID=A0AAW1MMF4_POPJA